MLVSEPERQALRDLVDLGLADSFRLFEQQMCIRDSFSVGWHTHRHRVIRNASCEESLPASVIGTAYYFGKRYPILRYSVAVPTVHTEGLIEDMALYCGTSCKDTHSIRTVRQVLADLTS